MGNKKSKKKAAKSDLKHILLLGSAAGGKSTFYKALYILYNSSWHSLIGTDCDNSPNYPYTRRILVTGLMLLIRKASQLYEQDNAKYSNCFMDLEQNETLTEKIKYLSKYDDAHCQSFNGDIDYDALGKLSKIMDRIWNLSQIQYVYNLRYDPLIFNSFWSNFDYWMDRTQDVMSEDYQQTDEDRLRLRIRTSGHSIGCYLNPVSNKEYRIYDVGGSRLERSKWIHFRDKPKDAIIFVIALDHYYQKVFEDESVYALKESLDVWDSINAPNSIFKDVPMFVLLNKTDVFKESLKHQTLKCCFGDEYKGRNYDDSVTVCNPKVIQRIIFEMMMIMDKDIIADAYQMINAYCDFSQTEYWSNQVYLDGIKFITAKVLEVRSENVKIYPLCAIDIKQVEQMIKEVEQI